MIRSVTQNRSEAQYDVGALVLREHGGLCVGEDGVKNSGRRRRGERNVSTVSDIPSMGKILCLFTPSTGGNEVRGDGGCGLLSVLQQRDEGKNDSIHFVQSQKSHLWVFAHCKAVHYSSAVGFNKWRFQD